MIGEGGGDCDGGDMSKLLSDPGGDRGGDGGG